MTHCRHARPPVLTDAQKLIVVQESGAGGATVSAVARRHGIATGILFRWRVEFGVTQKKQAKLASVTLVTDAAAALALRNLVQLPDEMMAIELPDGRRVFAPERGSFCGPLPGLSSRLAWRNRLGCRRLIPVISKEMRGCRRTCEAFMR
ncbi:transposase [Aminobacter sp. UC22_36]|uniref:transposase n=1 Tax=Aminobacter sp. UC22_36 TaxID=3374549 RepID=UPI0037562F5F